MKQCSPNDYDSPRCKRQSRVDSLLPHSVNSGVRSTDFSSKAVRQSQELAKRHVEFECQNASLLRQLEQSQQDLVSTSDRLASETLCRENAEAEAEELKIELEERHAVYKRLSEAHTRLQTKLAANHTAAAVDRDKLTEQVSDMTNSLRERTGHLQQADKEIQRLRKELKIKQQAVSDKEKALQHAEVQLKNTRAEADGALSALESARGQIQSTESAKAAMSTRIHRLTEHVSDLEQQQQQTHAATAALREQYRAVAAHQSHCCADVRSVIPSWRERDIQAAKYAVQEAVRDTERACMERNHLMEQLSAKSRSLHRMEKRWDACDRELAQLRRDHSARIAVIAELQATHRNYVAKISALEQKASQLAGDLLNAQLGQTDMMQKAKEAVQSRADLQLRQQQMEYAHKIQELELKLERVASSDAAAHPHNYVLKSEHLRLLDARLATQAAEAEAEMQRRLLEAQKESKRQLEAQAEETTRLEVRHLNSRLEGGDQEIRKLHERVQELLRKNEAINAKLVQAQDEARRAQHAAESAAANQKDAGRQLLRAQEAASEAQADVEEQKARAKQEGQRADAAEQKGRAAALAKEEMCGKLAVVSRALQQKTDQEQLSAEERCIDLLKKLEVANATVERLGSEVTSYREQASQKLVLGQTELRETEQNLQLVLERAQDAVAHECEQSRLATAESKVLRTELANARGDLKTTLQQMKALDEAVSTHKEAAGHAIEEARRLAASQQAAQEHELAIRSDLAEARQAASLASEKAADSERCYRQLLSELEQAGSECKEAWDGCAAFQALSKKEAKLSTQLDTAQQEACTLRTRAEEAEALAQSQRGSMKQLEEQADVAVAALKNKLKRCQEDAETKEAALKVRVKQTEEDKVVELASQRLLSIKEAACLQQQLAAARQEALFTDGLLQRQKQLMAAIAAALKAMVGFPMEMEQTLLSGLESESMAVVAQLPALGSQDAAKQVQKRFEIWASEELLTPISNKLAAVSNASLLRRTASTNMSASAQLEGILQVVQTAQTQTSEQQEELQRLASALERAKAEGAALAEEARNAAVAPLKAEVAALKAAVEDSLAVYKTDMAKIEEASKQHFEHAAAAAETEIMRLQDMVEELQASVRRESSRNERLTADISRLQGQVQRPYAPTLYDSGSSPVGNLLQELQGLEKYR